MPAPRALKWFALPAMLAVGVLVLVACDDDDETETGTGGTATPAATARATASPTATGAAGVEPTVSTSGASSADEIYIPVSDVESQLALALDARDIAALLKETPVDYRAIGLIYSQGKNSQQSDGTFRTLRGFATDPERAEQFPDAATFYGSPTFLADEIAAALNGTPSWWAGEPWSDAVREHAINKGLLRILYYSVLDEMAAAKADLAAGEVDVADGAPHTWDGAWAFYVGAEDESGARLYALAATALKEEEDYNKAGVIDEPLQQALAEGLEAIEAGDAAALEDAEAQVISRLNAIFYIATAGNLNNAYAAAASGDTDATAAALVEGLSFYRTIQPKVAAADPEADETIAAFYQRSSDSPITLEERDVALSALNHSAVSEALALLLTDMITPDSRPAAE